MFFYRERGNRALLTVLCSRQFLRLRNAFKDRVFEASKLVSTKTLLLKHYYRPAVKVFRGFQRFSEIFRGFSRDFSAVRSSQRLSGRFPLRDSRSCCP